MRMRSTITFRDAQGYTARYQYFVEGANVTDCKDQSDPVLGFIRYLTNAYIQGVTGPSQTDELARSYGQTNNYQGVNQKCAIVFQDSNGSLHTYMIPAPRAEIFYADGETLNPTFVSGLTDVPSFIGAMLGGSVCGRNGVTLASYVGGRYTARGKSRRSNINILSSNLDQPAM